VQWIILTLLGAIPGPVLFGIFIDKTCDLWEETCHGGKGNCLAYDNETLSYRLASAIFIFEGIFLNYLFATKATRSSYRQARFYSIMQTGTTVLSPKHEFTSLAQKVVDDNSVLISKLFFANTVG